MENINVLTPDDKTKKANAILTLLEGMKTDDCYKILENVKCGVQLGSILPTNQVFQQN